MKYNSGLSLPLIVVFRTTRKSESNEQISILYQPRSLRFTVVEAVVAGRCMVAGVAQREITYRVCLFASKCMSHETNTLASGRCILRLGKIRIFDSETFSEDQNWVLHKCTMRLQWVIHWWWWSSGCMRNWNCFFCWFCEVNVCTFENDPLNVENFTLSDWLFEKFQKVFSKSV